MRIYTIIIKEPYVIYNAKFCLTRTLTMVYSYDNIKASQIIFVITIYYIERIKMIGVY